MSEGDSVRGPDAPAQEQDSRGVSPCAAWFGLSSDALRFPLSDQADPTATFIVQE